jgi:flagellar hook protein FlgE
MTQTLSNFEENKPKRKIPKMALMWGVMLALLAGNIFAVWKTADIQGKALARDQALQLQLAELQNTSDDLMTRADTHEVMLRTELKETRAVADSAAGKASKEAQRKAEQMINKLAAEYRINQTEVADAIDTVGRSVEANSEQVAEVRDGVTLVAGEVSETQAGLDATQRDLHGVRGDLGVQSGLIATNAKELAALRKLGERTYHEFTIPKGDRAFRIANVAVQLRKTNPDKGRFTIDVIADDLWVPKKNRTVNEPIQFYVSGSRVPYEIVVNEVKKDRIVGYLSVPKVLRAAALPQNAVPSRRIEGILSKGGWANDEETTDNGTGAGVGSHDCGYRMRRQEVCERTDRSGIAARGESRGRIEPAGQGTRRDRKSRLAC